MSLKGTKRGAGVRGDEAGASKRRRTEPEDALWQLRPVSDLKMSSIYNRSASEAPAELFRKDLISAMMLADSEPLAQGEYWVITDTWKQDWERGVQVPVNPDSLPAPKVKVIDNPLPPDFQDFKLPRDKYIHLTRDAHYQSDKHVLSTMPARSEATCAYDLDAVDAVWLKLLNAERARAGAPPISEDQLEKVIEELEVRTWDKIQAIMKSEEGLNNEYDDVICDVCRSPDSEDGNEMVFCDSCNICVHQACYGITVIPDGQWLCRPCGDGVRPTCVLCPNLGGAMKCTPSGHKWAHVSCVLWIPEVSIGCAEKMEPITKISSIPASRWSLVCVLCRERKGACIQCSVKTCKTAYHVTCAFKHGLEMRAIIEDENADDGVKLRSYCQKHSVNSKKEKCSGSGSEEEEVKRKRRKDMTSEEKSQARAARLHEIEREFDRHVTPKDISSHLLDVDEEGLNYIYHYWKLKRRSGHNRPLLPPKSDDSELLIHRQEQADLDKMRMFVQLRQDLERVRNLCYMVSRREKLCRTFFRMREQTFHKQIAVLTEDPNITGADLSAIIEANHGPSIYDRLYSHADAADHKNDFEELLARIAPPDSGDEKKKDRNGMVKGSKSTNPYKKHYVNGSRRSGSVYSGLSSEESAGDLPRPSASRYRRAIASSSEDDKKSGPSPKKKVSPKSKGKRSPKKTERKKKKVPQSKAVVESSSEEESIKTRMKKDSSRSRTLQQMEQEMKLGQSGSESDDLIPMKSSRNNSKFPIDIYSDSSDEAQTKPPVKSEKSKDKNKEKSKVANSPTETDSQQSLPRTKAAMKEFIPSQPEKKTPIKEEEKPAPKKRGRKPSNKEKKTTPVKVQESDDDAKNKENIKLSKQKDPTDLIVPQRQAAKKASENMRSTTAVKKEEAIPEKVPPVEDKPKPKVTKPKEKEVKEAAKEVTPAKVGRKKSLSKDLEKETIAYVPQRQAAKKAAAHIKSGLGSKPVVVDSDGEKKKDCDKPEKPESSKSSSKKEEPKSSKVDKESSSSSSSSSSSYSSSSSSSEETDRPEVKPSVKAPSLFSPPAAPRPTVDLPFLDKVSRPLSSTSASSDSESSRSHRSGSSPTPRRPRRRRKRNDTLRQSQSTDASPTKALDKKLKTSERGPETVPASTSEGAESSRASRARTRSIASSGNMPHKPDSGQRKPSKDSKSPNKTPKETRQPGQLPTPERKTNEEITKNKEDEEKEEKSAKVRRPSLSVDLVENRAKLESLSPIKTSPKKSVDLKLKSPPSRRMSVKEPIKEPSLVIEETRERKQLSKARRPSRFEERKTVSPMVMEEPREQISKTRRPSRYEERKSLSPLVIDEPREPISKPRRPSRYEERKSISPLVIEEPREPISKPRRPSRYEERKSISPLVIDEPREPISKPRRPSRYEERKSISPLVIDEPREPISKPRRPSRYEERKSISPMVIDEPRETISKPRRPSRYEERKSISPMVIDEPREPISKPRRPSRYEERKSISPLVIDEPREPISKPRRPSRYEERKSISPLVIDEPREPISKPRRPSRYEERKSISPLVIDEPREPISKPRRPSRYEERKSISPLVIDEPREPISKPRRPSRYEERKSISPLVIDEPREPISKPRRASRYEEHNSSSPLVIEEPSELISKPRRPSRYEERKSLSPVKKPPSEHKPILSFEKKSPIHVNEEFTPQFILPPAPVEPCRDNYMIEHKSLDVEMTEKSSVKMIAKIQATLNENTMIKSPKTPMDARSMDQIDIENPMVRSIRKRSLLDSEKKYITQDSSHVQGVEISKSAKIPSAVNPFPNRSGLFSPQSNDKEIFEFDMMAVDDGFNHDEIMKPFTSYPEFFFKEDSKEQGVQETLNLVDRLRSQLSSKKMPAENSAQEDRTLTDDDKEQRIEENSVSFNSSEHETPTSKAATLDLHERRHSLNESHVNINHSPRSSPHLSRDVIEHKEDLHASMPSIEKWPELPPLHVDSRADLSKDTNNYDHVSSYNDELHKEPVPIQSDMQSMSETGDNVSLSKQSDDSQSHLSVVDHTEPEVASENQNYDNNNSVIHPDTIASPYIGHDKWGESKITTRRSSASSSESEESVCSQKEDCKGHVNSHSMGVLPELEPYPAYPLERVEPPMPLNQYAAYSEPPYLGALGLFGRPSPAPLYAPPLPYAPSPLIPPLPKPAFPTLGAAFTSSSQNIALTTAMIAPPTPKPQDSPQRDECDMPPSGPSDPEPPPCPALDAVYPREPSPVKLSNDMPPLTISQTSEPKSPPKPTKTTPKFSKSPGKSPAGISPKQSESKSTKRSSNRNNRGQRGRGRSKSRAQAFPSDYLGNSIHSKLVGTVYDFDEEIANDGGVDLKTLREKRKSIDVRDDRKSEHSYKERSQSPGGSGSSPVSKRCSEGGETREESNIASPERELGPVLPGPVDMRTYQGEGGATAGFLLAFESTAEQPLADIDEEVEKQLQTALKEAGPIEPPPPVPPPDPPLPKVSLSDSRNQLKVKIKGPFLDANYSASSRPPVPIPPAPAATFTPAASTNLRRMRKKELLRQYWTQDMNMADDAIAVPPPPAAAPQPPLPRAVITIPKAVASMTSIPTREDYKLSSDPPVEKKKRKTTSGLSRELRHLEVSMNDDVEPTDESKLSSYVTNVHKKRGRVSNKPGKSANTTPTTPKLKIKIGANVVQPIVEEPAPIEQQFRPPKKRLMPPAPKPSMEDIRRESMKYRKMVMADFEENEKTKKVKPSKSEKRKKKKDKKAEKLQVVNSESDSATKLIIKIKRPKEEESAVGNVSASEPAVDPFEYDPSAPDPLAIDPPSYSEASSAMRKIRTAKVTPIRLKIARSSQGSGYVMKGGETDESSAPATSQPPPEPVVALNKHCEVR